MPNQTKPAKFKAGDRIWYRYRGGSYVGQPVRATVITGERFARYPGALEVSLDIPWGGRFFAPIEHLEPMDALDQMADI